MDKNEWVDKAILSFIDTMWNVNILKDHWIYEEYFSFYRYYVECKWIEKRTLKKLREYVL